MPIIFKLNQRSKEVGQSCEHCDVAHRASHKKQEWCEIILSEAGHRVGKDAVEKRKPQRPPDAYVFTGKMPLPIKMFYPKMCIRNTPLP